MQGSFGPAAINKIRALKSQIEVLQAQLNETISIAVEAAGLDLAGQPRLEWSVEDGKNFWKVVEPEQPLQLVPDPPSEPTA